MLHGVVTKNDLARYISHTIAGRGLE